MNLSLLLFGLTLVGVLLVGRAYFRGLDGPLSDGDEAIYAGMIQEMHRTGDYSSLYWGGVDTHQRPPWAVALFALAARIWPGERGLRILPTLFTFLSNLAAGALVGWWTGRIEIGLATFVLASYVPTPYWLGRLLVSDPPFVLACLGALAATMAAQDDASWVIWAAVGLGGAFAVKSFGALVPTAALLPWWAYALWSQPEAAAPTLAWAIAGFSALALPFYVIGFIREGRHFWNEHFRKILFDRALGKLEPLVGFQDGSLSYARYLWKSDGGLLSIVLAASLVLGLASGWIQGDAALLTAASYCLVCFILLSVMGSRLSHYLLVIYPAAACCFGMVLAQVAPPDDLTRMVVALAGVGFALLGVPRTPVPDTRLPLSEVSKEIGLEVGPHLRPGEPVYTFDWYAPAVGVYARRQWHLLTTNRRIAESLRRCQPFEAVDVIHQIPPWPAGDFIVAGAKEELLKAPGLERLDILSRQAEGMIALRARAADRGPKA